VPKTAWLLLNVFDEFFQATEHFNLIISFVDHTIVWVFYSYYTLGSSYQPFRIKIHGALAVTFFFSPWPDFYRLALINLRKRLLLEVELAIHLRVVLAIHLRIFSAAVVAVVVE
jgi:hypothetical protein